MADEESVRLSNNDTCSISSSIDDSMSCSVPSLSVNDTLCSIPSLSIEESLPTTSSSEITAVESSRSSSSTNDFVRNVEEEMLKVSIDKTNIDRTTDDYPTTNQPNNLPHLHTSHRQEERAASASHRLLSEADNKLLSCPLELPTYKDDNTFPSRKPKKNAASQEVSKKKVTVSTCGTQVVQVKNTNERGVQAVVSKAASDKHVEKRVSFSSNIKTSEDDKTPQRSIVEKEDEPLYKVLTVSPKQSNKTTKNNNVSSNSNLELKSNTARSLVNTQHMPSTYQAFPTSKSERNKNNQVTSTRHTNFSSPYSFASHKESSVVPSNQVSQQRHDEGNEIATQTNSIMKPSTNTTHVTALPKDNHDYNTKLSNLEQELSCIRRLLDDTKSKSVARSPLLRHTSANNRHVPNSIDLPDNIEVQNDEPQLKLNNESSTPLSRTSTLTTIPFELQCTKTRLFPSVSNNNNRRRSAGKNHQSGAFSPNASFCGSGSVSVSCNDSLSSVSFIKPKRRDSRQLLHPRSSLTSKKTEQSK